MEQHTSSPGGLLIGYCRVSTIDQNLDRQLETIGDVDRLFTDHASGKTGAPRQGLEDCIDYLRHGDELRVASMDRLARSLIDLRQLVDRILAKGASVNFLKERAIYRPDATDPRDQLTLNLLGSFAEFERSLIRERQAEGIALAKAAGKYKGRAKKLTDKEVREIREKIAAGVPKAKLAREYNVNRTTLYRALNRD
ncbi:recombinase family protein [Corynebacterium pseudodiphtheriticum]|uniref:recombinase family protein n=1 Tax=Corynebacterium pseudodiphtheriticum TaxID=37637 RepID=UPI00234D388C|nr:recombinase family protein [Corynebacterium pseudodiphtheriticum]MDC7113052.1 recombinase family protein [Corynebacterium pseudodiphtheriticum]MDK4277756.1 recombinase family protein [Corynebacterium pseudodiphtheriticum]MDK8709712.1 recombinase family protein [Corynebacterium pseudodiphtheriticum]